MEKQTYKDGVHDISNADYHNSAGISRSVLWTFRLSPYHYWHRYLNPEYVRPEPTPSMVIGDAVHTMALEADSFEDRYAIEPDYAEKPKALLLKDVGREAFDLNKQQRATIDEHNKYLKDDFLSKCETKSPLKKDYYATAHSMALKLNNNDMFKSLTDGAEIEQSIYFTHKPTGIQCKVRPDAWLGSIVTDLKTTVDSGYRAFQMSAYKSGYFLQAGMIHEALKSIDIDMEKFVIACVENQEPHAEALYVLDDESIDFGIQQFNHLMTKMAEKMESGDWFSYELQTLCVPNWGNPEE